MTEDLTKKLPQTDSEKLTLILTTVQSLTVRVDSIDSRLQRVESRLEGVDSRLEGVDSRLQVVEQTMSDARPVWQLLLTNVTQLQEGQRTLHDGQRRLEQRFGHLEERFGRLEQGQESLRSELKAFRRVVDHRFLVLSGTVLARYTELEQRVTRLELNSSPPNSQT